MPFARGWGTVVHDDSSMREVDELIRLLGIRIVAVDESQAHIARAAYRDFAKRDGHDRPAQLRRHVPVRPSLSHRQAPAVCGQ